jgi:hypothetical protein
MLKTLDGVRNGKAVSCEIIPDTVSHALSKVAWPILQPLVRL